MYETKSAPAPPYSSGTQTPISPSSASFANNLAREAVLAIPLGGVRLDLLLREVARERLDLALLRTQLEVQPTTPRGPKQIPTVTGVILVGASHAASADACAPFRGPFSRAAVSTPPSPRAWSAPGARSSTPATTRTPQSSSPWRRDRPGGNDAAPRHPGRSDCLERRPPLLGSGSSRSRRTATPPAQPSSWATGRSASA